MNILGMEPTVEGRDMNAHNTGIPKFAKTKLMDRFQLISYNNYTSGAEFATRADSSNDVDRLSNESFVLLQHLNLPRVHVFAHRQVGYVALKLALDHPDLVRSIAFLSFEIAPHAALNPRMQNAMATAMQRAQMDPKYQERMQMMRQMMEAAKSGTIDGEAVDPKIAAQLNSIPKAFLEPLSLGADTSDPLSMTVKTFTAHILSTSYEDVTSNVKQPVLDVVFADGEPWTRQSSDLLRNWLPQTETYVVPKKAHWYSGQNDEGLAEGLADFYSRHPFGSLN